MKKFSLFLALIIVLATVGGIISLSVKGRALLAERIKTEFNAFTATGNLVERESRRWSLVYEEPGAAALKVGLIFNSESLCDSQPCTKVNFKVGDRAKVEGIKRGEEVIVSQLFTESLPTPYSP